MSMELQDKRLWLDDHGMLVKFDNDPDGSLLGVIWVSHGGVQFRGTGRTRQEMWGNLFDVVKRSLWIHCNT